MTKNDKVTYWKIFAEHDWLVSQHLFEKQDYSYSLFLAHLTLEKTLKALFVYRHDKVPPYTHRLPYLAEKAELILSVDQLELLEIATDFNMEARYPDEKFSFYKKCTPDFTEYHLKKIEEMKLWLLLQMQ